MKKKYLLPLLLSVPFLMSNAPAPFPSMITYIDVETSCNYLYEQEGKYFYQVNHFNKGGSYADINRNTYSYSRIDSPLFEDYLLAPNKTESYIISLNEETDTEYIASRYEAMTYTTLDENATFTDVSIVKEGNDYILKTNINGLGDYYYDAVLEIEYEGIDYAFSVSLNGKRNVRVSEDKNLDTSKIIIKNVKAYRSTYNTYKGGSIITAIIYIFAIALGLTLLLGITAAIVVPLAIRSKRRKRMKQNNNENR